MRRLLRLLDYALSALWRARGRTAAVLVVYVLLVALISSLILYLAEFRAEIRYLLADSPALTVQRLTAGRHDLIPVSRAREISRIRGVSEVTPRVWGYSYDPPSRATLTLWGAESVPVESLRFREGGLVNDDREGMSCVIGHGVAEARFLDVGDRLPLRGSDGNLYAPRVTGIFRMSSSILTNDLVVMPSSQVRRVFAIPGDMAVDLVVTVPQPLEVDTVARKIVERWGDTRTISRDQLLRTYDAALDWRAGLWLALILSSVAALMILVWDKASGMSAEEYREIGLLRALGWKSVDIMELKLIESGVVSVIALVSGILLGQVHLVVLDGVLFARILRGWSVLYPQFELSPGIDTYSLLTLVPLTVIPYLLASLVPAWRAAVRDPDSVLRS